LTERRQKRRHGSPPGRASTSLSYGAYARINRRAPAEADFQRYFKVAAPSVHQMLKTLDHLGLIEKQAGVARSIQLRIAPQELPILGMDQTVKISATGH
jgi:hypothetical protein